MFKFFITVLEKESFLFGTHREQEELYQCHMLRGTTATDSTLVKLRHINEGFYLFELYYEALSTLER